VQLRSAWRLAWAAADAPRKLVFRRPQDLFATTTGLCEPLIAPDSIDGLLPRECACLVQDEMPADSSCDVGRRSVAPMIVAVVMVLERL
jgi:hypothetical protein